MFTSRRRGERRRKRFPQMASEMGLGKAEVWSQALNPGLSDWWQASDHMNHHLLPSKVSISRKLESDSRART